MNTRPRSDWLARQIRIAVGQRLLLGLAPALLAVVLVLALAYYGEFGRQAPEYVVAGAGALAVLSLVLTWQNTYYIQARLRRLGRTAGDTSSTRELDDLDRIEREVERLTSALTQAARERAEEKQRMDDLLHEQATMLAATLRAVSAQVDEVRLPLHILLDARFGDLNENQEELLLAARAAADVIDDAVRRLGVVADADRDALVVRPEPVALNDIVRAVLPMVRATADRRSIRVDLALEPALPRVWANRAALAEAVALVATLAAEQVAENGVLTMTTTSTAQHCSVRIAPAEPTLLDAPLVIAAQRVLQVQASTTTVANGALDIVIPRALTATSPSLPLHAI